MIYLHHPQTNQRAAAECEASAVRLEQRGFVRISRALHQALWRHADRRALNELRPTMETAPLMRAVGDRYQW